MKEQFRETPHKESHPAPANNDINFRKNVVDVFTPVIALRKEDASDESEDVERLEAYRRELTQLGLGQKAIESAQKSPQRYAPALAQVFALMQFSNDVEPTGDAEIDFQTKQTREGRKTLFYSAMEKIFTNVEVPKTLKEVYHFIDPEKFSQDGYNGLELAAIHIQNLKDLPDERSQQTLKLIDQALLLVAEPISEWLSVETKRNGGVLDDKQERLLQTLLGYAYRIQLFRDQLNKELDGKQRDVIKQEKIAKARETIIAGFPDTAPLTWDSGKTETIKSTSAETSPKSRDTVTSHSKKAASPRAEVKKQSLSPEQQEKELLEELNVEGSTKVSISLKPDMLALGAESRRHGFNIFSDEKRTKKDERFSHPRHFQQAFDKNGINESVLLVPETEPIYKEIREEKPKWFGLSAKTEIRQEYAGDKPRLHSEFVKNGKAEPAYRLTYIANGSRNMNRSWRDYSNREGQQLIVELILPQSIAEKVLTKIKQDPTFIRRIAENQVLGKTSISRQAWEGKVAAGANEKVGRFYDPLRPPYERWAQDGQLMKMYIGEGEAEFDPAKVRIVE